MNIFLHLLLGLCLGSFFNVIVSRIYNNEPWHTGHSRCDSCGHALGVFDLIPIVSYILLKGKCRYCKEKIDYSHILSEVLLGIGFAVIAINFAVIAINFGTASKLEIAILYITITCLGFNAISDLKYKSTITEVIYFVCLLVGLLRTLQLIHEPTSKVEGIIIFTIFMAVALFALSIVLHKKIGAGDFDVAFLIYLSSGFIGMVQSIFYGSLIGLLIMLPFMLMRKANNKCAIPFVPLLYLGFIVQIFIKG